MKQLKLWKGSILVLALFLLLLQMGCGDRIDLDKSIIIQVNALDSTEEGELRSYITAPIFPEVEGKNEIVLSEVGRSLRHNRRLLLSDSVGQLLAGKIQVILFTKKFLSAHNLFEELNVYFRDPINPNDAILLYTEAPLESIFTIKKRLRPMVSTYIYELVDLANKEGLSVETTLERFNYLHYNKGMTPAVTEIGIKDGRLKNTGTVLLSKEGKRRTKLSNSQSSLLLLLRNESSFPLNYSFKKGEHEISFDMLRAKTKIRSEYQRGSFHFTVNIPVSINLTEYTLNRTFEQDREIIIHSIKEELKDKFTEVIRLCQSKGVDPVGFGMYARAYQYRHFKKVEDRWTEAFAEAEIVLKPEISIKRFGIVK
ncbi:Ger(x)C family spore germination protein [Cohnella sp.]|uniref:Ger(x)C family spore germination protein n=1 Tax=Cohnella sp. TaxID=1883426 RepID=UPI0035635683